MIRKFRNKTILNSSPSGRLGGAFKYMKKTRYYLFVLMAILLVSCEKEIDLSAELTGLWQQSQVYIDDELQSLSNDELNTSLFLEKTGVYRLFDGVKKQEHPGTWLFSDGEWLNMSMDKIEGKRDDGTYRFGQILVRFTVLNVNNEKMELRIRTYLFERKQTVMFNLLEQDDTTGMSNEEKIELDRKNKEIHTYRYVFKKVDL